LNEIRRVYRRNLPHLQSLNAFLFCTFRLKGSLPRNILEALIKEREREFKSISNEGIMDGPRCRSFKQEIRKRLFIKWDEALNNHDHGPIWLKQPAIAELVCESIEHRHPEQYELLCYTVMPNHVHMIFRHFREDLAVHKILGGLKQYTGTRANRILNRTGSAFWQDESFDHVIRDGYLNKTIEYVLNNPIAFKHINHWQEWAYSWLSPAHSPTG